MTKDEFKEKVKIKKWEVKNWIEDKAWKAKVFWDENKEYLVVIVPAAVGIGGKAINCISRNHKTRELQHLKDSYIYDRRLGCYFEMRRKPTQREYLEIDNRRKNGESMASILSSMRLLKR